MTAAEIGATRALAMDTELTIYHAGTVRDALLAALAGGGPLAIDLAAVAEIDCCGVQLLLAAQRQAGADGVALSWRGHSPAVLEALGLLELGARFDAPAQGGRHDA